MIAQESRVFKMQLHSRSAVTSQEYFLLCSSPFDARLFAKAGSLLILSMASEMECTSNGSTRSAASPLISGNEEVLEAITGTPHRIDSIIGTPNPSK